MITFIIDYLQIIFLIHHLIILSVECQRIVKIGLHNFPELNVTYSDNCNLYDQLSKTQRYSVYYYIRQRKV